MISKIYSGTLQGIEAREVEIEVNVTFGDPKIVIVGLPDASVKESSVRVYSAIANSGFDRLGGKAVINLAPADLRKEGPGFDLAIALGIIASQENLDLDLSKFSMSAELALDGTLRPAKGYLSLAVEARNHKRKIFLAPEESAYEASMVEGIDIIPLNNLRQAYDYIIGSAKIQALPRPNLLEIKQKANEHADDFEDVKGQISVKRALEIAAAGGHNILMMGPPGTGKSMLAKRLPSILAPMSEEEILETSKIHSVCGMLQKSNNDKKTKGVITQRPFRAPHHTISDAGLLGGGSHPKPGEISLAHNGVLFLDELPEFRRTTLEVLRQPLEDGFVTISRAAGALTFPANFMLVAAMNPCPCGYNGDLERQCRCSPLQVENYRNRVSGPLLDRIDIHIEVPRIAFRHFKDEKTEKSKSILQRILSAQEIQQVRFSPLKMPKPVLRNADMNSKLLKKFCQIDNESENYLEQAMQEMFLSARAHDRILKVARTIADLEQSQEILKHHILEAVQYRSLDRSHWG